MSLISPDSTFLVWSVVVATVGFGFWAEKNTAVGRYLTGIIVAMSLAMLIANLRILPFESPVYTSIFDSLLPLAIPLMLFRADVMEAIRHGGSTVIAFAIGALGIVIGALVATLAVSLGDLSALTAGLYTATYIGGSANFAAVAIAADFDDGSVLTPMIAADIVATNLQTMALVALPGIAFVRRFFNYEATTVARRRDPSAVDDPQAAAAIDLAGAAFSIATAMLLVYLGNVSADALGKPTLGIVFTTVFALILGNFFKPLLRLMAHDFDIGVFFVFLFLVALAAGADVAGMIDTGLIFFAFAMIVMVVHTAIVLVLCRSLGIDLRRVIIGSTACVGGVTSASAIASAKGWRDLIIPGILAGTLGNAFGTLLGVLVWSILS